MKRLGHQVARLARDESPHERREFLIHRPARNRVSRPLSRYFAESRKCQCPASSSNTTIPASSSDSFGSITSAGCPSICSQSTGIPPSIVDCARWIFTGEGGLKRRADDRFAIGGELIEAPDG